MLVVDAMPPPAQPHQPWLLKLHELLSRLGLPLRAVFTRSGSLVLWLDQHARESFVVIVSPLAPDSHAWASTSRFDIAYAGRRDLDPALLRHMNLIVGLLRRVEARLPAVLDPPDGLFDPSVPPEEQFLNLFPFCMVERSWVNGEPSVEVLVRTTTRCNQNCPFCSAPDTGASSSEELLASVSWAADLFPGSTVAMTGGEPTLRPAFAREVAAALAHERVQQVQVQTNAVHFARKVDPCFSPPSERLRFFVSLHATEEAIYDECTGTRGQLPLALQGMRRLIEAGHWVTINCVVQARNIDHLPGYVASLPKLLPMGERVDLHFSSLICHDRRPAAADFLVRYAALARALESAAEAANRCGVRVQSLLSSTHASIPACLLTPEGRALAPHRPSLREGETAYEGQDVASAWLKAHQCRACSRTAHCLGVPRAYAERFGLGELTALQEG